MIQYAHEYLTEEEAETSSTYRELLGVLRCLRALMHLCEGKFVVLYVDVENLLGIVNRGSAKLHINVVARELFKLCVERDITLSVELVPRELNSLADELSKFLIPSDWIDAEPEGLPPTGGALGEPFGGLVRVGRELLMREVLFVALVPWLSRLRRFHARLGRRRGLLGQLPIPLTGQSLAQAP